LAWASLLASVPTLWAHGPLNVTVSRHRQLRPSFLLLLSPCLLPSIWLWLTAGATKVVWVGDLAKSTFIPTSGPACYVFDSNGILIQWDLETGHGRAMDRFHQQAWQAEPMTVQEAIDFIGGL